MRNLYKFQQCLIVVFTAFFVFFGVSKVFSQSVELVDMKTGKPADRSKMPRFFSIGVADGFIMKTKVRFGAYTYLTNFDDSRIAKTIFYSDSNLETRKYFQKIISESKKIIKSEKSTKGKLTTTRILTLSENDGVESYEVFIYTGGKSFVSISTKKLEILEEFEKYLTGKN